MGDSPNGSSARFAAIVREMSSRPGVTHSVAGRAGFGQSALKFHDKVFAMVSSSGHFVVNLPTSRVDALVNGSAGRRIEANLGEPMDGWLEVYSESIGEWFQLAGEALEFVKNLT